MIRTLAGIAALAIAMPAIASAQTTVTTVTTTTPTPSTVGEIVVHGHTNVYRIVLNTAGKSKKRVKREIAFAARKACERVNDDWAGAGASSSDMDTCVSQARNDAERQYDENRTDWLYEAGLAPPERIVIPDLDDDN
jgi:hypothetical protein